MYVLKHNSGCFYCGQNLYMGAAILTESLDKSEKMSLDSAERTLSCMGERGDWKIYRVEVGLRLAEESVRHDKRAKKEQLIKELRELGDV